MNQATKATGKLRDFLNAKKEELMDPEIIESNEEDSPEDFREVQHWNINLRTDDQTDSYRLVGYTAEGHLYSRGVN